MAQLLDTTITGFLTESKGADIAAGSTVDLSTATGNFVTITGAATITSFGTVAAGARLLLHFSGICTITHNATSLILPGGSNIVTAAGDVVAVMSLGSGNWRCTGYQRAYNCISLRDTFRNLTVRNNTSHPNYQVDVAADEVTLQDTDNNPLRITSLSVTVDITASGANGLDTGSEASSTWYHIWAIAKADGTKAGLLSTSATAPTMPSGYIFKAYAGAVYNNASSNFVAFEQVGNMVGIAITSAVAGGTAATYTAASLATIIPTTAKRVFGWTQQDVIASLAMAGVLVAATSTGFGESNQGNYAYRNIGPFLIPIVTAQTIYHARYGVTATYTINVSGWFY